MSPIHIGQDPNHNGYLLPLFQNYQTPNQSLMNWLSGNKEAGRQFIAGVKSATTSQERNHLLMELAKMCVENHYAVHVAECLNALSLAQLMETIGHSLVELNHEIDCQVAAEQFDGAAEAVTRNQTPQRACALLRGVKLFFETILRALTFFHEPLTTWEAAQTLSLYTSFLAAPFVLLGLMGMIFSPLVALTVTAAIFLGLIAAITIYAKYFRGYTENPYPSRDLTAPEAAEQVHMVGRQAIFNRAIEGLSQTTSGQRKHPLLVGRAGVGKTILVESLGQRILRGEVPHLKSNGVLRAHTGQLADNMNAPDNLQPLEHFMGHVDKRNNVIVFDEIQEALNSRKNLVGRILEEVDHAPKVIAITTPAGYKTLRANPAFERRFQPILMPSTTPDETRMILQDILLRDAPELEMTADVLRFLAPDEMGAKQREEKNRAADDAQPDKAKQLLYQLINRVQTKQSVTEFSEKLNQYDREIESKLRDFARAHGREQRQELVKSITDLKIIYGKELVKHKNVLKLRQRFFALKRYEREQHGWRTELAMQFKRESQNELLKKRFFFMTYYFNSAVQERIGQVRTEVENGIEDSETKQRYGAMSVQIDVSMVKELIKQNSDEAILLELQ